MSMMQLREALSRTLLLARDAEFVGANSPTDEQFIEAFRATTVMIVADEANLSTAAGQHALVALFSLVARLGVSLRLAISDVPLVGFQPPIQGQRVRSGLLDFGRDILPGCEATVTESSEPVDVAFILGASRWHGRANIALRLSGDAWSGHTAPASAPVASWSGAFPIGALTAAGIAAPEAFKAALRKLSHTLPFPVQGDFLMPVTAATVRLAPVGAMAGPYSLGRVDAISGGAITNAALFTLLRLPNVVGDIRVIEPDRHDFSNLNRYPLLRRSQASLSKIEALRMWEGNGLRILGLPIAFTHKRRADAVPLAPTVLVGTDDIAARWDVQREWPDWLGIGATSHCLTVTSSHLPGNPCAGCLHPYDDAAVELIPTVSFVSFWAGLLLAVRLLRYLAGYPLEGTEQSVMSSPLRLDQARAYLPMPVPAHPACPVRCPASRRVHANT